MRHLLAPLLPALVLVAGITPAALGATPQPETSDRVEGPVYVDSTDILYLESFPVQVRLDVTGSVPTPCHAPAWLVEASDEAITVTLWSEAPADAVCASVLAPFEVSIHLGDFETADLPVTLNGEEIGRVVVGEPSRAPSGHPDAEAELTGAGWSFGMCAGLCRADLEVDGDLLILRGSDTSGTEQLFENRGDFTSTGREHLDAALAALGDTPLEDRYGCPDCADGGASYVTLLRDGRTTHHDMEFGSPPPELAELVALTTTIIDALQACQPDELVDVEVGCEPWHS